MSVLCGVCNAAPPKYRCPTCQLRYCSLACFKPHKATHATESATDPDVSTPQSAPSVQPPHPVYTVYNLKNNPAFLELLDRFPFLKAQLTDIWHATLPPSAPINADQPHHVRGGRQTGRFKQEKADEDAARAIGRARNGLSEDSQGLREFVKLISGLGGPTQQQQND